MTIKSIALSTLAVFAFAPALALAHDGEAKHGVTFKGPVETVSIKALLEDTSYLSEKDVIVDGYLMRQINRDQFVFSDGESEINIELDDDIHLSQPLDSSTKVRLYGEYEGGNRPEIEIEHIQIL